MVDFDSALDDLTKKNQQLQERHSKVLAQIEYNKQRYLDSLDTLKALDCDSVEEAQEKVEQLRAEIEDGIAKMLDELE